jgi:hypothetical protein
MERGRKRETEGLREGEIREGGKEIEGEGWREGRMEGRREREAETSGSRRVHECVCVCVCPKMSFADSYRSVVNFHINLNRGDED